MEFNQVDIHASLKKHFGFSQFKGLQEGVVKNVLEGKDTFVIMATGGGKSLCFQFFLWILKAVPYPLANKFAI